MNRHGPSLNSFRSALGGLFKPRCTPIEAAGALSGEVSLLERRRIEAMIAVPVIRGYELEMGVDRARQRAAGVIMDLALEAGERTAGKMGGRTLPFLARIVREMWCGQDALAIQVLEETEERFRFHVIRCRYAEQYEELGIREYGPILSCCRDEAFVRGFNARIGYHRTQTIMEGGPFCDFEFEMKRG